MFTGILMTKIGILRNRFICGRNKFLSLILTLIVASYAAMPDRAAETLNQGQQVESTGLIAVNYLQVA